jgi:hypothetical protein
MVLVKSTTTSATFTSRVRVHGVISMSETPIRLETWEDLDKAAAILGTTMEAILMSYPILGSTEEGDD